MLKHLPRAVVHVAVVAKLFGTVELDGLTVGPRSLLADGASFCAIKKIKKEQ